MHDPDDNARIRRQIPPLTPPLTTIFLAQLVNEPAGSEAMVLDSTQACTPRIPFLTSF
jgi:hypothetical protein